jgi:hypothetical protein
VIHRNARRLVRRPGWRLSLAALVATGAGAAMSSAPAVTPPSGASASQAAPKIVLKWSKVIDDQDVNGQQGNVTESSPTLAVLSHHTEAAVFGDSGGTLYALKLSNGKEVPGWPAHTGEPIQSSPSVAKLPGATYDTVFVGGGSDADPDVPFGAYAFNHTGKRRWVDTLTDSEPAPSNDHGVTAGLTVVPTGSGPELIAGTTGQIMYGITAANGRLNWDYFTADSVHSTPAVARNFDRAGPYEVVEGGDSTYSPNIAGQAYANGGHIRVMTPGGSLICEVEPQPDQTIDSSPVVADLTPSHPSIVTGTGYFYGSAQDSNAVMDVSPNCQVRWIAHLNGETEANPAVADFEGAGHKLQVAEAASPSTSSDGVVYVLNNRGKVEPGWPKIATAPIQGWEGIATADLSGHGYQDLLVPTATDGVDIFDGKSARRLTVLAPNTGFQNAPLITTDPDGRVGITLAGYQATENGCPGAAPCLLTVVDHYEVTSKKATIGGPRKSWHEFHHDSGLSGNINQG